MEQLVFLFMAPLLVSGWRAKADAYLKAFALATSGALVVNSFLPACPPPIGPGYEGFDRSDYELIFHVFGTRWDGHFTNARLLVNMDVSPQSSLVMPRHESITDEYVDELRDDLRACVATNNQGSAIIPPMLRKRGDRPRVTS